MADLRRCIGSARFEIEAHDAPVADFPVQPSKKDGLGRMCKPHWNAYTTALRTAAATAKAEDSPTEPEPLRTEPSRATAKAPQPADEKAETGTA